MSKSTREQLLDHLQGVDEPGFELPFDLKEQLRAAPQSQSWWAGCVRQVRGLRLLRRKAVPGDLEGRAVAAIQGGHRQQRAVDYLAALSPRRAPIEVQRSVQEVVEAQAQGAASGYLAPAELDERVASELVSLSRQSERLSSGPLAGSSRPGAWLAAALLLVTVLGLGGLFGADEVLAGDLEVARSSALGFGDITAFECIQVEAGSPEATGILRGLDALVGGAHEGSRRLGLLFS